MQVESPPQVIMYRNTEWKAGFKLLLVEIRKLGWAKLTQFDCAETGVTLTLTSLGHTLRLSVPLPGFPLKEPIILHHDLPQPPNLNSTNLTAIYNAFIDEVNRLEPARIALTEVDHLCKVLDPDPPQPSDLHRQIVLKPGVFLHLRIDPDQMSGEMPRLTFLGPEQEVKKLRMNHVENVDRFDPNLGLVRNLENVLDIEIPGPEIVDDNRDDFNIDCGICYAHRLGQLLPERACENEKCGKQFHVECLYMWLQTDRSRGATRGMDNFVLRGKCPYCDRQISCERPKDSSE